MKKRQTTAIGSGITEREELDAIEVNAENSDLIIDAIRSRNRELDSPWASNRHVIDRARARLQKYEKYVDSLGVEFEERSAFFKKRDSLGWYLREIVALAQLTEMAANAGRTWEAVDRALLIGECLTELKFKALWENYALKGKKHQEASERNAEERRLHAARLRYRLVRCLRRRGHSWENCYRLAATKLGVSASTVKKDCLPQKKLDPTVD